ncbi:hypothetical protein T265_04060 [Opisthorchis viverrini]|uniref:Uncharacterized protein n=1 Tax=Opisthorchis viverrini TaxID=6198 RepID=A0A074ZPG6_OPIVI|nr:hypothetical protein T265_04060 [Opisthorchis viverrini]KER29318.1 hypothetical protein T265_04060 [Opisthorchis viverrini]
MHPQISLLRPGLSRCMGEKNKPNPESLDESRDRVSANAFVIHGEKGPENIMRVDAKRDLGIWVSSNFSVSLQHEKSAQRAFAILRMIRRTLSRITRMDFQILHGAYIRPLLELANQVAYSGRTIDFTLIERVQRAATRMVAGLESVDYETRLGMLDLFPLEYRRLRGDLILTYALFEQSLTNRFFTVDPANTWRGHNEFHEPAAEATKPCPGLSERQPIGPEHFQLDAPRPLTKIPADVVVNAVAIIFPLQNQISTGDVHMVRKRPVARELVTRASAVLPSFTDIFDEETFYLFFACLVVLSFVVAFTAAWYFDLTVTDAGDLGSKKRRRRSKLRTPRTNPAFSHSSLHVSVDPEVMTREIYGVGVSLSPSAERALDPSPVIQFNQAQCLSV